MVRKRVTFQPLKYSLFVKYKLFLYRPENRPQTLTRPGYGVKQKSFIEARCRIFYLAHSLQSPHLFTTAHPYRFYYITASWNCICTMRQNEKVANNPHHITHSFLLFLSVFNNSFAHLCITENYCTHCCAQFLQNEVSLSNLETNCLFINPHLKTH